MKIFRKYFFINHVENQKSVQPPLQHIEIKREISSMG